MTDDRDRSIEALLRQTRQDDDELTTTEQCVDAEALAEWVDGSLSGQALADAEQHAAGCVRCQALLASMAKTMPEVDTRPWWRSVTAKWLVPVAAVATALVVWVSVELGPEDVPRLIRPTAAGASAPLPPPAAPTQVEQNAQRILDDRAKALASELKKETSGGQAGSAGSKDTLAQRKPVRSPPADAVAVSRDALMAPTPAPERREAAETGRPDLPKGPPPPVSQPQAAAAAAAPAPQFRAPAPPVSETVRVQSEPIDKVAAAGRGGGGGGINAFAAAPEIRSPQSDYRWRIVAPSAVQRSVDGGVTWTTVTPVPAQGPVGGLPAAMALIAGSSPSRDVCWIVGRSGIVLVTTDGATWQRRPIPEAADLTSVRAIDARTATVITADGRQFATADGGITWTPARQAPDLGQE